MHWTTMDSLRLHSWDMLRQGRSLQQIIWRIPGQCFLVRWKKNRGNNTTHHVWRRKCSAYDTKNTTETFLGEGIIVWGCLSSYWETNDWRYNDAMHWEIIENNLLPDRWQWTKKVPNNLQHWNPVCVEELDQHLTWSLQRLVFFPIQLVFHLLVAWHAAIGSTHGNTTHCFQPVHWTASPDRADQYLWKIRHQLSLEIICTV